MRAQLRSTADNFETPCSTSAYRSLFGTSHIKIPSSSALFPRFAAVIRMVDLLRNHLENIIAPNGGMLGITDGGCSREWTPYCNLKEWRPSEHRHTHECTGVQGETPVEEPGEYRPDPIIFPWVEGGRGRRCTRGRPCFQVVRRPHLRVGIAPWIRSGITTIPSCGYVYMVQDLAGLLEVAVVADLVEGASSFFLAVAFRGLKQLLIRVAERRREDHRCNIVEAVVPLPPLVPLAPVVVHLEDRTVGLVSLRDDARRPHWRVQHVVLVGQEVRLHDAMDLSEVDGFDSSPISKATAALSSIASARSDHRQWALSATFALGSSGVLQAPTRTASDAGCFASSTVRSGSSSPWPSSEITSALT
eukprot:scaffold754_cov248-Pinguiococcus_pyrenoidosus.AAC.11